MHTTKIKVQYKSGSLAKSAKVTLIIDGIFSGGHTKPVYTDSSGMAFIDHSSKGNATVYVNGKNCGKMRVPGQNVVFI